MRDVRQGGVFPETRWSLILRLRAPDNVQSAKALDELCQVYWQPLYAYLRRSGRDIEESKDVVQGFLAQFLSRNGFERIGPTDGPFRRFLLGSLRNYVVSLARRDAAVKRGGDLDIFSFDIERAEEIFGTLAAQAPSPEAAFDRQWAQTVWSRALARLREEQRAKGREALFDALKPLVAGEAERAVSAAAASTGLTPAAVSLAVHRLRRRLRELVIDELSETVGDQSNLDDELNYFLSVWSK